MLRNKREIHLDAGFTVTTVARTPEGFLDIYGVSAVANKTLTYPDKGRVDWVAPSALRDTSTLIAAPVTLQHPNVNNGLVTPENAKELQVGFVRDAAYDEQKAERQVRLRVTDAAAIKSVLDGATIELSEAYFVTDHGPPTPEAPEGTTRTQKARVVNHLAIVDRARAGVRASLIMDAAPAPEPTPEETMTPEEKQALIDQAVAAALAALPAPTEAPPAPVVNVVAPPDETPEGPSLDSMIAWSTNRKNIVDLLVQDGVEHDATKDSNEDLQLAWLRHTTGNPTATMSADDALRLEGMIAYRAKIQADSAPPVGEPVPAPAPAPAPSISSFEQALRAQSTAFNQDSGTPETTVKPVYESDNFQALIDAQFNPNKKEA